MVTCHRPLSRNVGYSSNFYFSESAYSSSSQDVNKNANGSTPSFWNYTIVEVLYEPAAQIVSYAYGVRAEDLN
jgi:hypothetical protein